MEKVRKQVLEIEVPDDKKAVWKNNHIVFEDVDTIESIKTIYDAIQFLTDNEIYEDLQYILYKIPNTSFEW